MDNPPEEVRPGLSCTAKITTATRKNVLTIPDPGTYRAAEGRSGSCARAGTRARRRPPPGPIRPREKARKEELTGVFVVSNGKATFKKVDTGITGATDIEVLSGLNEGDQIITGTYQVIRTIKNDAQVKVDNKPPVAAKTT